MVRLFNEIYGTYYRITAKALEKRILSEKDISDLIDEYGTDETRLGLSAALIPPKNNNIRNESWGFFVRRSDGMLESIFGSKPMQMLTLLEKRWLRSKLSDRRIGLFLSDDTLSRLEEELADVEPLYPKNFFRCFDRFSDGDDMSSPEYRRIFQTCLSAYKEKKILYIKYMSAKGNAFTAMVLPLKLEYSFKNDKFRMYCRQTGRSRSAYSHPYMTVNIGRIEFAEIARDQRKKGVSENERSFANKEAEPIVVRVSRERNAIERFMLEFAAYSKNTTRDPVTGECEVRIQSKEADETELLIRLLGFGPTIEIISPEGLRKQAAERIKRQYELFFGGNGETVNGED